MKAVLTTLSFLIEFNLFSITYLDSLTFQIVSDNLIEAQQMFTDSVGRTFFRQRRLSVPAIDSLIKGKLTTSKVLFHCGRFFLRRNDYLN